MIAKELEYAEKRMQQKWHDLVMAEQRGATVAVLERMYSAYMLAVEEFNRCSVAEQQEEQQPKQEKKSVPQRGGSGKKKAS